MIPVEKTGAAAASQAGLLHLRNDVGGFHLSQNHIRASYPRTDDNRQYSPGVDDTAVAQHDAQLLAEKVNISENAEESVIEMIFINSQTRHGFLLKDSSR